MQLVACTWAPIHWGSRAHQEPARGLTSAGMAVRKALAAGGRIDKRRAASNAPSGEDEALTPSSGRRCPRARRSWMAGATLLRSVATATQDRMRRRGRAIRGAACSEKRAKRRPTTAPLGVTGICAASNPACRSAAPEADATYAGKAMTAPILPGTAGGSPAGAPDGKPSSSARATARGSAYALVRAATVRAVAAWARIPTKRGLARIVFRFNFRRIARCVENVNKNSRTSRLGQSPAARRRWPFGGGAPPCFHPRVPRPHHMTCASGRGRRGGCARDCARPGRRAVSEPPRVERRQRATWSRPTSAPLSDCRTGRLQATRRCSPRQGRPAAPSCAAATFVGRRDPRDGVKALPPCLRTCAGAPRPASLPPARINAPPRPKRTRSPLPR
jgi:hypothetical protein